MQTRNPVSLPNTIPVLKTDRLTLRALTPDYRAAVFALFADPRVAVPTHFAPFERIEQADELIAFYGRCFATKDGIRWGLTLRGVDTIIGTAGFRGIDDETYRAILGYNLAYICEPK
jgi:ribosomal-protein-alanine N-acetyltransferase